jgi:hypothetical protein
LCAACEPSWEPFAVDWGGRLWTLVKLESRSFLRTWALMDARGHGLEIYGSEGWGSNSPSSPSHLPGVLLKPLCRNGFSLSVTGGSSGPREPSCCGGVGSTGVCNPTTEPREH